MICLKILPFLPQESTTVLGLATDLCWRNNAVTGW